MNETLLWTGFGIMMLGSLMWRFSSFAVRGWLADNDPTYEPDGIAAKLFIGELFTSFKWMPRYRDLRAEKGEDAEWQNVFWAGLGATLLGLFVLFGSLASI